MIAYIEHRIEYDDATETKINELWLHSDKLAVVQQFGSYKDAQLWSFHKGGPAGQASANVGQRGQYCTNRCSYIEINVVDRVA